jgi:hypothetical protein
VKKINRPRDDIQKRLYEIAEVSLEVKFLYGDLQLRGLNLRLLLSDEDRGAAQAALRRQIVAASPVVVGCCSPNSNTSSTSAAIGPGSRRSRIACSSPTRSTSAWRISVKWRRRGAE